MMIWFVWDKYTFCCNEFCYVWSFYLDGKYHCILRMINYKKKEKQVYDIFICMGLVYFLLYWTQFCVGFLFGFLEN